VAAAAARARVAVILGTERRVGDALRLSALVVDRGRYRAAQDRSRPAAWRGVRTCRPAVD
jgi:hypothetical protein